MYLMLVACWQSKVCCSTVMMGHMSQIFTRIRSLRILPCRQMFVRFVVECVGAHVCRDIDCCCSAYSVMFTVYSPTDFHM